MTRLFLELRHLHEHKLNHNFQNYINPFCSCSTDIELTYPFFCTLPYLTVKVSSSSETYAKLIAN